jgi:hypothetical protein
MSNYENDPPYTIGEIRRAAAHGPAIGMRIWEERATKADALANSQFETARYAKWSFVLAVLAIAIAIASWLLPHLLIH